MPKYTFVCPVCNHSEQNYVPRKVSEVACEACYSQGRKDVWMKRKMPTLAGRPDTTEVVDEYTGTVWKEDQQELIKQRKDEYYWSIEVPRLVNSGTYSIETMVEMG